jgi:hypothetical protein
LYQNAHLTKNNPIIIHIKIKFNQVYSFCVDIFHTFKKRESIRDATAELQVKIIWLNWIPVFKIYQCYVPSINLLALLVHMKKMFLG